jgi:hypothetical protein
MAKKKQARKQVVYIRRLAENDYIQKQLRDAATALGKAYQRATRRGGQAVEDEKLYGHLRTAAISIRNLSGALRRPKPEPEPKHRARTLIAMVAAGGSAVLLLSQRGSRNNSSDASNVEAADAAPGEPSGPSDAPPPTGD